MDNMIMQEDQKTDGESYCIEIYVGPGNQVQSVKVEQKQGSQPNDHDDYGAAPSDMGQPSHDEGMQVKSIDEALQTAARIYESGGKMNGQSNDRESIAKQVFGDIMTTDQEQGQMNRKPNMGGRY